MRFEQIEARIFELSDQAREKDDKDMSRALVTLVMTLRDFRRQETDDMYRRYSDLMRKWNEFSNGCIAEEHDRQKQLMEDERSRVLRLIAVDPHWEGTYADLLRVVNG